MEAERRGRATPFGGVAAPRRRAGYTGGKSALMRLRTSCDRAISRRLCASRAWRVSFRSTTSARSGGVSDRRRGDAPLLPYPQRSGSDHAGKLNARSRCRGPLPPPPSRPPRWGRDPEIPKRSRKNARNFANSDVHRNAQNSAEKCRTMPFEGAKVARKVARFTVLNVTPLL